MSKVLSIRESVATDVKNMLVEGNVENKTKNLGRGAGVVAMAPAMFAPVFASTGINTFFNTLSTKMKSIYDGMKGYVHVFAAVLISIALLVRLFSKNPRSIEEANGWIKNIIITWLMFNMLSILVQFMGDFKTDSFNEPWGR